MNPPVSPLDIPAPPFVRDPAEDVTLNVTGLVDKDTTDAFYEKLGALARQFNGGNGGRISNGIGGTTSASSGRSRTSRGSPTGITFAEVTRSRSFDRRRRLAAPGRRARPADSAFIDQALFDLRSPASDRRRTP